MMEMNSYDYDRLVGMRAAWLYGKNTSQIQTIILRAFIVFIRAVLFAETLPICDDQYVFAFRDKIHSASG